MATGTRIGQRPTYPAAGRGVPPSPVESLSTGGDTPITLAPAGDTPPNLAGREMHESRIIAAANLAAGASVRVDFRFTVERLRLIQRTAAVVLALGYGREPSPADFDDLSVGAIYFDFPIRPSVTVSILNMGGVALADDLVVIGMAGERYRGI